MSIFKNPNFDFLRWRWHAIGLSTAIIVAGLVTIAVKGLPLGIEFSGGTNLIVQFDQTPDPQRIRQAVDQVAPGQSVVQSYGDAASRQMLIRVGQTGREQSDSLSETADKVVATLKQANMGNITVVGTEIVGPVVGSELTRKGIMATILSIAGILVYIALRFQFSFAVGATIATLHDILVTLAFLTFFGYELSLNVIAAILTIAGYSVNDTIVIFDRVRENVRSMRRDSISTVINTAVNQTLSRTIITAGLTFLAVVALYLFGGEVLRAFAFAMLVGIVSGTYSTVFIASAIVTFWRRPMAARSATAVAAASKPVSPKADVRPARSKKSGRRAS